MSDALTDLPASVTTLTATLVRTPSRAGIDRIDNVAQCVSEWCEDRNLPVRCLQSANGLRGLLIRTNGSSPGRTLLLNACLDTADFGDIDQWEHSPTSALVVGDWLHGRGSADSKMGVAIFLHLAQLFWRSTELKGELLFYFDADEHTGAMNGIKAFQSEELPVDFAMIGYPGSERVMIGARGFLRIEVSVYGTSSHSGSKSVSVSNAVVKAAHLASNLSSDNLLPKSIESGIQPKVTVTGINGGGGFALVPDKCMLLVDIRLTDTFHVQAARALIARAVEGLDAQFPTNTATRIHEINHLPFYQLEATGPPCEALLTAARSQFGPRVSFDICGPSNIGNLLAIYGIPATCGFGVRYRNIHAANESAFLPDIVPVFKTYETAIKTIMS